MGRILNKVCIPMAGQRITNLLAFEKGTLFNFEEIMIELKLCISLLFTPFHQHLNKLADKPEELAAIWLSLLAVVSQLLGKETAVANNVDNIVTSFNNVETGSDSVTSTKDI